MLVNERFLTFTALNICAHVYNMISTLHTTITLQTNTSTRIVILSFAKKYHQIINNTTTAAICKWPLSFSLSAL